jgi:phosphonate transport system substrate-binding protein
MNGFSQTTMRNGSSRNGSSRRPLQLVTYLAPNLFWFYEFISRYLAERLRCATEIQVGSDYTQMAERGDLVFVCGLPYVELTRRGMPRLEPLVAPVLEGERYGGKPIYFSDVIVRQNSPFGSFADLRGRSWAYNEPQSQSGYGIVRHSLIRKGETNGFFGKITQTGFHEQSIQMVDTGAVDASAIDSHLLALVLRDDPGLAERIRIIDTFGPSSIQPILAGPQLPDCLKSEAKKVLLEMADDPIARPELARALIKRFEPVSDATYDDIRWICKAAEATQFLTIR